MSKEDVIEINEPNFVIELKHMKSGSALVLSISKLRVSGDDLDEVMQNLRLALSEFQEASEWLGLIALSFRWMGLIDKVTPIWV